MALFEAPQIAPAGGHRSGMARFGQLDLAGSAWEWTLDLYRPYRHDAHLSGFGIRKSRMKLSRP